jgi:hypothetical protein
VERYPRAKLATLKIRMDLLSYRLYCSEQEHPNDVPWVIRLLQTHGGLLKCLRACEVREHGMGAKLTNTTETVVSLNNCLPSSGTKAIYSISTTRYVRQSPANGNPILSSKGRADVLNLTILTSTVLRSVPTRRRRRRSRAVGASIRDRPRF